MTIWFLDWGKAFCLPVIHCVKTDPPCMKMEVSGDAGSGWQDYRAQEDRDNHIDSKVC